MTNEQEAIAKIMRLDGKSVNQVAAHLGVPEKDVQELYWRKKYKKSIIGFQNSRYIRLDRWMREHGMSRTMFAQKSGIHISTLASIMNDEVDFSKSSIDKILKTTGLTYEEAFQRSDEWQK